MTTLGPYEYLAFKGPEVKTFELRQGAMVFLYCERSRTGGATLLPDAADPQRVRRCISYLIEALVSAGADASNLRSKLIGGRTSLSAAKQVIETLKIRIVTEVKDIGSTVELLFYPDSGRLRLATLGSPSGSGALSGPSSASVPSLSVLAPTRRRVLIVEDSATMAKLLSRILSRDPGLEVVGIIDHPFKVEKAIQELKPDVMTLDLHLPDMDGCQLLEKILPRHLIPTVLISSISNEAGTLVLKALELGAVDYIQKPSHSELAAVSPLIIEKVKMAAEVRMRKRDLTRDAGKAQLPRRLIAPNFRMSGVIAIGSSTGGTEALREIFSRLPEEIPPIVVVQHIPPVFSKAFAERMNSLSPFEVKEAEHGDEVKPNRILIAPGGRHMEIESKNSGYRVVISDGDPVNRHRPSVDVLFDSVARNVGKRAIGVILTGMGNDGAHGLKRMRDAGARTVAQDEASSVVFGMPREAIRLEAAMAVKPLDEIAELLVSWMGQRAAA